MAAVAKVPLLRINTDIDDRLHVEEKKITTDVAATTVVATTVVAATVANTVAITVKKLNPLLDPVNDRDILDEIWFAPSWDGFSKQLSKMWSPDQVNLFDDTQDMSAKIFENSEINSRVIEALKQVQTFFAIADSIVSSSIKKNILAKIQMTEAAAYFTSQQMIEFVHQRSYGKMFVAIIPDKNERDRRLKEARGSSVINKKMAWIKKWTDYALSLPDEKAVPFSLFILALTEGLAFPFSFLFLTWLMQKAEGRFSGIMQFNNLISRDELQHAKEDIIHYNYTPAGDRIDEATVREITTGFVDCEYEFAQLIIAGGLPGLGVENTRIYIECLANVILEGAKYKPIYPLHEQQPFDFMNAFYADHKKNFFDVKSTEYNAVVTAVHKPSTTNGAGVKARLLDLSVDM